MSKVEFSVSANTAVAIFRVNVYWGFFEALYRAGHNTECAEAVTN
jgi:hypothetical protein